MEQDTKLLNDILYIINLYNNLTHKQQLIKLRNLTQEDKFPIQTVQDILSIKYSTAQAYFKKAKLSSSGNWMGNKIPLEYICKLCLHYNKSLEWFLCE